MKPTDKAKVTVLITRPVPLEQLKKYASTKPLRRPAPRSRGPAVNRTNRNHPFNPTSRIDSHRRRCFCQRSAGKQRQEQKNYAERMLFFHKTAMA